MNRLKSIVRRAISPERRYYVFTILSFVLLFLLPYAGWTPVLIVWVINACLGYREKKDSPIRFVHVAVGVVCGVLAILNIIMGILNKAYALY